MQAEFERDGAVLVRDVVPSTTCSLLHEAIERCRAAPSEHYAVLSKPGRAPVDSDLFRWFDDAAIRDALFTSALAGLAATLLGGDAVVLVEDQWFASAPGADTASPWHQDEPYYNIDGAFVTLWLALDDAPAGAALSVVAGSHRWGRTFAPVAFVAGQSDTAVDDSGRLERLTPADIEPAGTVSWDVSAGDVIALHPLTLHSAGSQPVPGRWFRRLSTRWAAPTARYVDRGEQAADFWRLLPHGLRTGDPLACATFPLVVPNPV
jgi:hypothetical protein